ncbi:MAG: hypothetical protein CMG32_06035 [Candidatus Marinimicrobia bacterium]|nr:hypothetical protein [Candidatus Neomarinimicrobiota bacterium]
MIMDNLKLSEFNSISLKDLDKVQLLNRKDTKFVFSQNKLLQLLDRLKPLYRILEIEGKRTFVYDNTYFDTDEFFFYTQHHNECRKRFKVRYRKYCETKEQYFEIKVKDNKNRTIKNRLKINDGNGHFGEEEKRLISETTGLSPQHLIPKLDMQFSRITLADNSFNERLTIDTNLSVKNGISRKIFDQLVISEIKQKKYNPKSDFIQILRNIKIPEMRFSKYCMGMLHVNRGIKYNRFKPKLLQINKILTQV